MAALLLLCACGDDAVDPDPRCLDAPPLIPGRTEVQRLEPGDAVLDGSLIDYYHVLPDGAGTLTIEMAAELPTGADAAAVDPFLYLWFGDDPDPVAQAYDPTGGGPLLRVARLTAGVGAGCYRVGASGWPSSDEGEYTIRAELTRVR